MTALTRLLVGALALMGAATTAGLIGFAWSGISARHAPSVLEAWAARSARHFLIPAAARRRANPVAATPDLLALAKDHFTEHCVGCHGYDGRGDTPIARGLSPRPPDLTLAATQDLSDGELYWIIENGIKLTGMPAFAEASEDDDEHGWHLVLWVRHLPDLTPEEVEQIEREARAAPAEHHHHEHSDDGE